MGQPVVHFEIIGNDPEKLRGYYGDLFGWEFDTPHLWRRGLRAGELWVPGSHDLGGWSRHPRWGRRRTGYESHAVFYVGVADVKARCSEPRASEASE